MDLSSVHRRQDMVLLYLTQEMLKLNGIELAEARPLRFPDPEMLRSVQQKAQELGAKVVTVQ